MKICVFADIHGNGPAFTVAHRQILTEDADANIFLGDLCGYYFDQKNIYELILSIPRLIALQGNHDQIFLKIIEGDEDLRRDYIKKYGNSIEHLLEENYQELHQWLLTLPKKLYFQSLDMSCYHGSPWNPMEGYVYPDSLLEEFLGYTSSIFVLGHTHYPMKRLISDRLIVNPGSLGQPRQGGWPTYAIIEYPSKRVIFKEIKYDKSALISRVDELDGNNEYLKEVIIR